MSDFEPIAVQDIDITDMEEPVVPQSLSSTLLSLPDRDNTDFFKALLDEVSNGLCFDWDAQNGKPGSPGSQTGETNAKATLQESVAKWRNEQKTTVLQIASNVLNIRQAAQNKTESEVFNAVSKLDQDGIHLENFGGFFVVLAEDTTVQYCTPNVSAYIHTTQAEMIGTKLLSHINSEDKNKMLRHLGRQKSGIPATDTGFNSMPAKGSRIFFHFRMKSRESGEDEHFNIMGNYRHTTKKSQRPTTGGDSGYAFLGVIRQVQDRPMTDLSLLESVQDQYITRHLTDGKIIFADHRISTVCGYLPSEIVGNSGYNFIFSDDLPWTTMANRQMFASWNGEGCTTYRVRCKSGEYITVQTRGYVEFNRHTEKVESFMCINTVVSDRDASKQLEEQKGRFTPFIIQYQMMLKKGLLGPGALAAKNLSDLHRQARKRKLTATSSSAGSEAGDAFGFIRSDPAFEVRSGQRIITVSHPPITSAAELSQVGKMSAYQEYLKRAKEASSGSSRRSTTPALPTAARPPSVIPMDGHDPLSYEDIAAIIRAVESDDTSCLTGGKPGTPNSGPSSPSLGPLLSQRYEQHQPQTPLHFLPEAHAALSPGASSDASSATGTRARRCEKRRRQSPSSGEPS